MKTISGVPQGSIFRTILFNLSISDLFFLVEIASVYNFDDDNTMPSLGETVSILIDKSRIQIHINSRLLLSIERNPIL